MCLVSATLVLGVDAGAQSSGQAPRSRLTLRGGGSRSVQPWVTSHSRGSTRVCGVLRDSPCFAQGLKLHAAFKLSFILAVLQKHGLVSPAVAESVTSFIAANQTFDGSSAPAAAPAAAATPAKPPR